MEGVAVTDDGIELWFRTEGDGPPVVLCHGGPGLWDHLDGLAALLPADVRTVRWEQRGCGRSTGVDGPFTVARAIADLDQLRAHLGVDRWTVVGHSWGATLALHYALVHPDRTVAVGYLAGTGLGRAWNAAFHAEADRRLAPDQLARREVLAARPRTPAEEVEWRTLVWATDYADLAEGFERAARDAATPVPVNVAANRTLVAETTTWDEQELIARCARLDRPVVVVHGSADPRPSWAVESLVDALPHGELHVLEGAGHHLWVERPAAVASILSDLVAGPAAPPPG